MTTGHEIVQMERLELHDWKMWGLAAFCAAVFSALRVSNEVEKQYGRGLAWETSGIWLRRFFGACRKLWQRSQEAIGAADFQALLTI
ncbi:MAG: hypothetical protein WA733_12090 [Methylocystis sp.]